MAELIDREKLLKDLKESSKYHAENSREEVLLLSDRNIVREQQLFEERKKGKWKKKNKEQYYTSYCCSICGRKIFVQNNETLDDYPYCHCGAEMRG